MFLRSRPAKDKGRCDGMTWLIAIICIILIIYFWRIFLPLGIVAAIGLAILIGYFQMESNRNERNRKLEEQAARERTIKAKEGIAKAKDAGKDIVREWEVFSETDPASGKKVPRSASVLSDDGLCRLQIEKRINGTRLAGIYCPSLKISSYEKIEVKFDNRDTSDTMKIERFSNSDDVFISSYQSTYDRNLSYDEFLRRMTRATKIALLLDMKEVGKHWITFSLGGSGPALMLSPVKNGPRQFSKVDTLA